MRAMLDQFTGDAGDGAPPPAPYWGKQVKIHGLQAKSELNGAVGFAASYDEGRGRYTVNLPDGCSIALQPTNLELVVWGHEQGAKLEKLEKLEKLSSQIDKLNSKIGMPGSTGRAGGGGLVGLYDGVQGGQKSWVVVDAAGVAVEEDAGSVGAAEGLDVESPVCKCLSPLPVC
jgi:hypothetical protein